MKEVVLGSAGSSGAGYSQLRMQSNLTGFIEDESKKSIAQMAEKGQLASFPKVCGMESDLSSPSTYLSDGKMGRWKPAPYMPRGQYAMGAPRANMSHCVKSWVSDVGTVPDGEQ